MVVSNKLSFGKQDFKYFIGYKNVKKIRPLCIFCSKMSICVRDFDKTKCMNFLIKNEKVVINIILGNYKFGKKLATISKKVNKELQCKLNQHKKASQCICTRIILIDSVYRKD